MNLNGNLNGRVMSIETLRLNVIISSLAVYGYEPTHLYDTDSWNDPKWLREMADLLYITLKGRMGIPLTDIFKA